MLFFVFLCSVIDFVRPDKSAAELEQSASDEALTEALDDKEKAEITLAQLTGDAPAPAVLGTGAHFLVLIFPLCLRHCSWRNH